MSLDCVQVNTKAAKKREAGVAVATHTLRFFICCSPHHFSWVLSCHEQQKKCVEFRLKSQIEREREKKIEKDDVKSNEQKEDDIVAVIKR